MRAYPIRIRRNGACVLRVRWSLISELHCSIISSIGLGPRHCLEIKCIVKHNWSDFSLSHSQSSCKGFIDDQLSSLDNGSLPLNDLSSEKTPAAPGLSESFEVED